MHTERFRPHVCKKKDSALLKLIEHTRKTRKGPKASPKTTVSKKDEQVSCSDPQNSTSKAGKVIFDKASKEATLLFFKEVLLESILTSENGIYTLSRQKYFCKDKRVFSQKSLLLHLCALGIYDDEEETFTTSASVYTLACYLYDAFAKNLNQVIETLKTVRKYDPDLYIKGFFKIHFAQIIDQSKLQIVTPEGVYELPL